MLKLPTTPDRLIDKQYVALMQNGDISLVTGFNAPPKNVVLGLVLYDGRETTHI